MNLLILVMANGVLMFDNVKIEPTNTWRVGTDAGPVMTVSPLTGGVRIDMTEAQLHAIPKDSPAYTYALIALEIIRLRKERCTK